MKTSKEDKKTFYTQDQFNRIMEEYYSEKDKRKKDRIYRLLKKVTGDDFKKQVEIYREIIKTQVK